MQVAVPLKQIFIDDPDYAWQLLDAQAHLQQTNNPDGREIANLLSLYMRAVQKLNELRDRRQVFFKSKMSGLMMRPNVVKSLNKKPSAKNPNQKLQSPSKQVDTSQLATKKKQFDMRLTYISQQNTPEQLTHMIRQHYSKSATLEQKIAQIVTENEQKFNERLEERIAKRKGRKDKSQVSKGDVGEFTPEQGNSPVHPGKEANTEYEEVEQMAKSAETLPTISEKETTEEQSQENHG